MCVVSLDNHLLNISCQAAICGDEVKITNRRRIIRKNDDNHQTQALHDIKKRARKTKK
jgi:hypothetical protein